MDALQQEADWRTSVKSLSLEDLVNGRPPFFARIAEFAKTGLMIWGAISLSAAAGFAAVHLKGASDEPVLRSEQAVASHATEVESDPVDGAPAEIALPAPDAAEQILLARLPRPRPDEPIFTGSISRASSAPRYANQRYSDPCAAWNSLRMPFRISCVREHRAHPYYRY